VNQYKIDLGDDEFVSVPENIRYKIIQDHLQKSYHWVIGIGLFLIGFLTGVIAG